MRTKENSEGYNDYFAGYSRNQNPYAEGSIAYYDWDSGWEEANGLDSDEGL